MVIADEHLVVQRDIQMATYYPNSWLLSSSQPRMPPWGNQMGRLCMERWFILPAGENNHVQRQRLTAKRLQHYRVPHTVGTCLLPTHVASSVFKINTSVLRQSYADPSVVITAQCCSFRHTYSPSVVRMCDCFLRINLRNNLSIS